MYVCVHYEALSKHGKVNISEEVHLYFTVICLLLYITGIINERKETTKMTKILLNGCIKAGREWIGFEIWKREVIDSCNM
jgi:hypothetical protein